MKKVLVILILSSITMLDSHSINILDVEELAFDTTDIQIKLDRLTTPDVERHMDIRDKEKVSIINFATAIPNRDTRTIDINADTTYLWVAMPTGNPHKYEFYSYTSGYTGLSPIKDRIAANIEEPFAIARFMKAKYVIVISLFKIRHMPENILCYMTQSGKWEFIHSPSFGFTDLGEFIDYQFGSLEGYFNTYDQRNKYFKIPDDGQPIYQDPNYIIFKPEDIKEIKARIKPPSGQGDL